MKLLTKLCLMSFFAGTALGFTVLGAAAGSNFAGTWAIHGQMGDENGGMWISPVCTLKQDGNEIHGTCKGPNAFGTASGAVDGEKILLTWKRAATNSIGHDSISTLKGTLGDDGIIRGTWTDTLAPEDLTGDWTGQKVK